ncbi:hypothetical protein KKF86_05780 [bacterium]|nr:hypothetical protein [bacterium]
MIDHTIYIGTLRAKGKVTYLETASGGKIFENEKIWDGYIKHWANTAVNARRLTQLDYEDGMPIIIMWPEEPIPNKPFIHIYYNERLVKYFDSTLGHLAINVNGKIFNFAKKINENEILTKEEYFYRPALGEFAPSPNTGKQEISVNGKSYFDKFGRNFMRGIHVLHVEGIDTDKLFKILKEELDIIHNTPPKPEEPENYPDFHVIKRSCTSIVRNGLRKYGFKKVKGVVPRDFFVNAAYNLQKEKGLKVKIYKMPQLLVPECSPSKPTFLFNIKNWFRVKTLKYES